MRIKSRKPLFQMVKDKLIDAMVNGSLRPGEFLPSLRQLCKQFEVSLITIQRAVRELQDEDWLVSHPRRGVAVADPLPGISRLHVVKKDFNHANPPTPASGRLRHDPQSLICMIDDEALVPLFEWAGREYADALGHLQLEVRACPLPGRDDGERTEADILLLPSCTLNRFAMQGTITPAEDIFRTPVQTATVQPELLALSRLGGKLWGMPILAETYAFMAHDDFFTRTQTDPGQLTSVAALLDALEKTAPGANVKATGRALFGLTIPACLLLTTEDAYPGIAHLPDFLSAPATRDLLARIKRLSQRPDIDYRRFDQEGVLRLDRLDSAYMVAGNLCRAGNLRQAYHVLPIPCTGGGRAIVDTFCLCVSAYSLHPFEAWEWIARLTQGEFFARLTEQGMDLPASSDPRDWDAFGKGVGHANAGTLRALLKRPSDTYGMHEEDVVAYLWEVIHHELHRFLTDQNDDSEMLRRVEVKTRRFLLRK
ncbi:MAG: GntR family transcriptional regulator [Kiritimatiellae bacterium]|nr:GntR family transcriptional regulator [Kiritimatiellia bacterium]